MLLAEFRGVKFHLQSDGLTWAPNSTTARGGGANKLAADFALNDVALALGYGSSAGYNHDCVKWPDAVRRRLEAL